MIHVLFLSCNVDNYKLVNLSLSDKISLKYPLVSHEESSVEDELIEMLKLSRSLRKERIE